MKPYSDACARNQGPILEVLRQELAGVQRVLEIGSGTGQHAVYFGAGLPHVRWQPSDRFENLDGIRMWVEEAELDNVREPVELDVTIDQWPASRADAVFSANTAHIMSWEEVEAMLRGVGRVLGESGVFCLYGPFNNNGSYTSHSNARFDEMLRQRDARMGIRDFEELDRLARAQRFEFKADYEMPANNRTLVWARKA